MEEKRLIRMLLRLKHHKGFSLVELLVVLGIFVILAAILVPMGKRLRENNRTSTCEAHLQHIGQALRMYYLDEGGVPPIGVEGTIVNGVPTPTGSSVDLAAWPSLQTLFVLGYLRDRGTLHCPRHTKTLNGANVTVEDPEYYASYILPDPLAKPTNAPLKQYKYMPYRWATASDYPNDYQRQLTTNVKQVTINGTDYLVTTPGDLMPADDTIVTWCNYHRLYYQLNGHGQYLVLYWDGSVKLLDEELFTTDNVGPAEAWLVKPTDTAH